MKATTRNLLVNKCIQLTDSMSVRSRNIVMKMLKNVEDTLEPLLMGQGDVRSLPLCGEKTAVDIKRLIDQLQPYYIEITTDEEKAAEEMSLPQNLSLKPNNKADDTLLQELFVKMVDNIANTRTRNLIKRYIKNYRQGEVYLKDPSLVGKWHGAGQQTIEGTATLLKEFHSEYLSICIGEKTNSKTLVAASDYPFLSPEEQKFVIDFKQAEGRYPVLFIAKCYFHATTVRPSQLFARANGILGEHKRLDILAEELHLTRERLRQLSLANVTSAPDAGRTWDYQRWKSQPYMKQPLLTADIIGWEKLSEKEHLGDLDFYSALTIIKQMRPLYIVAMRNDGRRANNRLPPTIPWTMPEVLFACNASYEWFPFENALLPLAHNASMVRKSDERLSLTGRTNRYFGTGHSDGDRHAILDIIRQVLPMFNNVSTEGDDIILKANRIDYTEVCHQILSQQGKPMTINQIYNEFKKLYPNDPHSGHKFLRSYLLNTPRIEPIGSKSTYQLPEWGHFAGSLGQLAEHILLSHDVPIRADELCQLMAQQRPSSTWKSCYTSIYLAITSRRLLYYIDSLDNTSSTTTEGGNGAPEDSYHYIGLYDRQYPPRYWPSTITLDGALRSLHRFIDENQRWPFSSKGGTIESMLYYVMRKIAKRRCVTDDEVQRYHEGIADIPADRYPTNRKDLQFGQRCQQIADYCRQHHRLPTHNEQPTLMSWYKSICNHADTLIGFRKQQLALLADTIATHHSPLTTHPLPPTSALPKGFKPGKQLTLDFNE